MGFSQTATSQTSTYLSIYLPTYLPTYLPIYLPSYLPTFLSTYLCPSQLAGSVEILSCFSHTPSSQSSISSFVLPPSYCRPYLHQIFCILRLVQTAALERQTVQARGSATQSPARVQHMRRPSLTPNCTPSPAGNRLPAHSARPPRPAAPLPPRCDCQVLRGTVKRKTVSPSGRAEASMGASAVARSRGKGGA